jgi:hypothetical protein
VAEAEHVPARALTMDLEVRGAAHILDADGELEGEELGQVQQILERQLFGRMGGEGDGEEPQLHALVSGGERVAPKRIGVALAGGREDAPVAQREDDALRGLLQRAQLPHLGRQALLHVLGG